MEIVVFKVDGCSYGMDIEFLEAIEELDHVTPVANAPQFISGISNVRGEIVPVFDLAGKFSIRETNPQKKYIVVRLGGTPICFSVDEVEGMRSFNQGDVFELPEVFTSETGYFTKALHLGNNRLALVIAPDMLIPGTDQENISEFVSNLE